MAQEDSDQEHTIKNSIFVAYITCSSFPTDAGVPGDILWTALLKVTLACALHSTCNLFVRACSLEHHVVHSAKTCACMSNILESWEEVHFVPSQIVLNALPLQGGPSQPQRP